jgi:hypothetical protein
MMLKKEKKVSKKMKLIRGLEDVQKTSKESLIAQ